MASSSLPPLSAAVTRILSLTGFPATVKTKDVQTAFSDYEGPGGGFKIKWVDDNSLLLVFNDPITAKRAYLNSLLNPPASLENPDPAVAIQVKPYDGPDSQIIIFSVNNRRNNPTRGSISHGRNQSLAAGGPPRSNSGNGNGLGASMHAPSPPTLLEVEENANDPSRGRGGSPTLPNLAEQPTLSSMLGASLSDLGTPDGSSPEGADYLSGSPANGEAVSATFGAEKAPPRVGDAGRRMVGAALGVKHPGLASRRSAGGDQQVVDDLSQGVEELAVVE